MGKRNSGVTFVIHLLPFDADRAARTRVGQTLPHLTRERFVRHAHMPELGESGIDQNVLDKNDQPGNGGYNRGYVRFFSSQE